MSTTIYSDQQEYLTTGYGCYVRAKFIYSVSETDETYTISGTVYLQHKGNAGSGWGGAHAVVGTNTSSTSTDYVKSFSAHNSWTDINSTNFSETVQKQKTPINGTIFLNVLFTSDSTYERYTIPAKTSYIVSYNANSGSNPPDSQTKWYNESLVITTDKPTRDGYTFIKWCTDSTGESGTDYLPGGSYTANSNVTLYAIWEANPVIETLTAIRCDEYGVEDNEGEYALITCEWYIQTGNTGSISGTVTPQNSSTSTPFVFSVNPTGSGSVTSTAIVGDGNGIVLDTNTQYTISVTIVCGVLSNSQNVILTRSFFVMDWKAGGYGIGIGRAAPDNGLEVGYETTIDNQLHVLEDIDTPQDVHCRHIYTNGWTWNELYDTFTWNRLHGGLTPPSS